MGKRGIKPIEHRVDNGVELKYCLKCKTWKGLGEFYKEKGRWDKLNSWCRTCVSSNVKPLTTEGKARMAITGKRWRENNRQYYSEYQKNYRDANQELLKAKQTAKREDNRSPDFYLRQCKRCKEYFHIDTLHSEPYLSGGTLYLCFPCLELRKQETLKLAENRRLRELEKQAKADRLALEKQERERIRAEKKAERKAKQIARELYLQSPEHLASKKQKKRDSKKKQYWKDPEKSREKSRRGRKKYSTPQKRRDAKRKRRALERGVGGHFTTEEWEYLLNITRHRCIRCGKENCPLAPDHVVLLGFGSDLITNIQPYCWSCNSKKLNRYHEDSRDEQTKYLIYQYAHPNLMVMMEKEEGETDVMSVSFFVYLIYML